ncbi:MAG: potassium transporter Kup [Gammaproteobacteria bacterium]
MSPAIAVAVLGVVYGDIGTSPIYALRQCFFGETPLAVTTGNVLGVLSLIFWTLLIVISLKYMRFVLQADNRGEGGTFALLALLRPHHRRRRASRRALILLGVLGASMLYGGIMITPAISVLSAVEGLTVAAPQFAGWVIPLTVVILIALFFVQRRGTAKVGALFGPVMFIWFVALAALGFRGILKAPQVLLAINPAYAVRFFLENHWTGYFILYAVFLVTTGGEALYADLGHFGRSPIRRVWFSFVLPALLLNYFGQGALLIAHGGSDVRPFYELVPTWALYPFVALAMFATCIASQAVITGAFSLTRQAIQLGLLPRLLVEHTSADSHGQIYMPAVNWLLMLAAVTLVLIFRSSGSLAAAYGVAVNSAMAITTVLAFNVARERGGWSMLAALTFLFGFLAIDFGFLGSNLLQFTNGGWVPVLMGVLFFILMTSWRRGAALLAARIAESTPTVETFIDQIKHERIRRAAGSAVFLTGRLEQTPPALLQLTRHTGILFELVILLTVIIEPVPMTSSEERVELSSLGHGFYRLTLHYGFMQGPNVPEDLSACPIGGITLDLGSIHYFIGHVDLLQSRRRRGISGWRDRLFIFMASNTEDATASYRIPPDQVMKVGLQVGI